MRVGRRWRSSENCGETDVNKEKIYDERINPLMAQIIELCKQNGIAMVASFAIPNDEDDSLRCTSHLADETGAYPFADAARLVRHGHRTPPMMLTTRDGNGNVTGMTSVIG
jgi:hypothetical protein